MKCGATQIMTEAPMHSESMTRIDGSRCNRDREIKADMSRLGPA